jgi:hypothetical protein
MYTAQFPEALQLERNHCNKLCESSLQLPQPQLDISRMSQSLASIAENIDGRIIQSNALTRKARETGGTGQ